MKKGIKKQRKAFIFVLFLFFYSLSSNEKASEYKHHSSSEEYRFIPFFEYIFESKCSLPLKY
jgi:hypothetical protein